MTHYSVAKAKDSLSSLIDKALAGEEVVITRHGKAVVELRIAGLPPSKTREVHEWLKARRDAELPMSDMTSVELLNLVYEDYPY